MNEVKVLMVIAFDGYQSIEYGITKRIIEDAGFRVITASTTPGSAVAQDGSTTEVNIVLEKVNVSYYAGVVFIGGPGALDGLDNQLSYTIIQDAYKKQLPLGAICISTRIFANAGILDKKYATGWNDDGKLDEIYQQHNVSFLEYEDVVVDAHIVTAVGPSAAQHFAERFVQLLEKR